MVPAANRLRRSPDFRAVVREGKRAGCPRIVVAVSRPESAESTVVGFSVGKPVGNAVVRNRVRRKLRHLMRERLDLFAPGSRAVVRALPPAAAASSQRLGRDVDAMLARLGVTA